MSFYKQLGYDGVFITNHFLDGNICHEIKDRPYEEQVRFYFSDYEKGAEYGRRIGMKVFSGVELSYKGTDFLIYGLDKEWYLTHPEIMGMKKSEELSFLMEAGAFVVQAHPYREEYYIDHVRLFPRSVHAAEIINSSQKEYMNEMAAIYAERYGLYVTAGSDNHWAGGIFKILRERGLPPVIAGMESEIPLENEKDYMPLLFAGKIKPFTLKED